MSYLMPYFMTNKEWYTYDPKTNTYTLTDKAPKKARESYEQFIEYISHPFFYGATQEGMKSFVESELKEIQEKEKAKQLKQQEQQKNTSKQK